MLQDVFLTCVLLDARLSTEGDDRTHSSSAFGRAFDVGQNTRDAVTRGL